MCHLRGTSSVHWLHCRGQTVMDVLGLLILLLSALVPAALGALRDYHFVSLLKNWTEAQSYCREKFFDLATVGDVEEWAKLKQLVGISGHEQAWIGLYDDINSWRWSLDNKLLYENGSIGLGSWFVFSVNNLNNKGCALIHHGKVIDFSCSYSRASVCYDEPTNSYIYVHETSNWQSAQSYCRSTYTDLASIRNQQEWNTINSSIPIPTWGWWVGLSREGWKWSDQSDSSYRAWLPGEPSGGSNICGTADADGWSGAACHLKLPFICSASKKRLLKLELKIDPPGDLNDPQIQAAILAQIERQLRQQGIQQQLRVRWRQQPNGDFFNKTTL